MSDNTGKIRQTIFYNGYTDETLCRLDVIKDPDTNPTQIGIHFKLVAGANTLSHDQINTMRYRLGQVVGRREYCAPPVYYPNNQKLLDIPLMLPFAFDGKARRGI
jgi:hypothetical protein